MLEPASTVETFHNLPNQTLAAGVTIFENGKEGEIMYGILEGEVELWIGGKVVETISKGDVFGEGALVRQEKSRASTAIAKTDCTLAIVDRERFLFLIQETPMFGFEVIKSLSDRLRRLKRSL